MPGPIHRDSLSKCTQGNDLYAMIRNPTIKIQAQPPKQMDTLKSLQGQMERDAIAHLGKAMQNFIFVARAGKFLFLAIAMPPYILLYGLPKFILIEAIPNILQQMSHAFKLTNEKIKKLFKEDNKGVLSYIKSAFAAVSTKAAEYVKWIDKSSKALFAHLKHQVVSLGYRLLQPYLPILQKSAKTAEAVTKMLLHKTYEKGDKHLEIARKFASFAWKVAKQELVNQTQPFAKMVKNTFSSVRKLTKKLIEKPRLEIQKFKKTITHSLKKTNEVLKSTGLKISKNSAAMTALVISYTAKPLLDWSTPKIQWTASFLQSGQEKIAFQFERIRGFMQNLASGAGDAVRMSRQAVAIVVKNVFEAVTPSFIKHFFNSEGGFKKNSREIIQNLGNKIKKVKNAVLNFTADYIATAKNNFFKWLQKIRLFFSFLGQQIKQFPKRLLSFGAKSYHISIFALFQTGHFFKWLGFWSRVLVRLAWIELRETTAMMAKFHHRERGENREED